MFAFEQYTSRKTHKKSAYDLTVPGLETQGAWVVLLFLRSLHEGLHKISPLQMPNMA